MSASTKLLPQTYTFLKKEKKLLIDGEWVSAQSGKTFTTQNPSIEETLSHVAHGESQDIDRAVQSARAAFDAGPWTTFSASHRSQLIWKLADLIEDNKEELAQLEALDNGKPYHIALAADIPLSADIFRYMAGWCTKLSGDTFPISVPYTPNERYFSYTTKEPVGVVGQIIPWNFPLLMAAWKLAPALATACTTILKPAEQTSLTALRLGELILEAGFPKGVVNIVTGFGDAGAHLAAHSGVDKVAFTGSTEVGKSILTAAQHNLKKVSLELGGKSPNVLFKDANLDLAIPGVASSIFFNHGQCCCAGSRLYVEKEIFERVVEGVKRIADELKVGDGFDPHTQMGPLISKSQQEKVCSYIDSGLEEGATLITGGKSPQKNGYFVNPTLLTNTNSQMKVVREEIFGPVVTVMPFTTFDDVVTQANDSNFGLAAGIWTQDIAKAHRLSRALKAGTTWINCYNIFDAALPFGGYKESGWGREMGKEVLELYSQTKSSVIKL